MPPNDYGDFFHADPAYGVEDLLSFIEQSVLASLWFKASEHYCGKGFAGSEGSSAGPALISFKLFNAFRRQGLNLKAGVLECLLCGDFVFNQRVHEAFPETSPLCDRCDLGVPAIPFHVSGPAIVTLLLRMRLLVIHNTSLKMLLKGSTICRASGFVVSCFGSAFQTSFLLLVLR